jgi:hypothetical protein
MSTTQKTEIMQAAQHWAEMRDVNPSLAKEAWAALGQAAERSASTLEELRKACAELLGQDPSTWPKHGNAPLAIAAALALALQRPPAIPRMPHDLGQRYRIEFDGFVGTVIGSYRRLDGEDGVVMQQDGTKVVHVYRRKWLQPADAA